MTTYPNAYCVKCGTHTETLDKRTVVLKNEARALTGHCASCASEVYRIMAKKKAEAPKAAAVSAKAVAVAPKAVAVAPKPQAKAAPNQDRRVAVTRPAEIATASQWTYVAAGISIIAIISGFMLYSVA